MTHHEDLLERLERANPVPDPSRVYADPAESRSFLHLVEQRRELMDETKVRPIKLEEKPPRSNRGIQIAAAAFVIVAGIGIGLALLTGDADVVTLPTGDDVAAAPTTSSVEAQQEAADTGQASDPAKSTVTFDGADCVYAGAMTFDLNTLPELAVVNMSQGAFAFALYQLEDPSLTLEDARAMGADLWVQGRTTDATDLPDGIRIRSGSGTVDAGEEGSINLPFTASGDYLVGCQTLPLEPEDRAVFLADTVLTVR